MVLYKIYYVLSSKLVAFLLFLFGAFSFLSLSQNELNYETYMSENALLVGLIKNRFNDATSINTLYKEISGIIDEAEYGPWLISNLEKAGLDVGIQNFTFRHEKSMRGQLFHGKNVYGILRSPGAARSQAILITVPLRKVKKSMLFGSIASILALAKYSRYDIYWAMDIIFLFPEMEYIGLRAWLDSYHGIKEVAEYINGDDLPIRSGSIFASLNLELRDKNMDFVEFKIEGINGGLPNLDLFNAAVRLAYDMNIPIYMHGSEGNFQPRRSYYTSVQSVSQRKSSLYRYVAMMWQLARGSPSGLHGLTTSHYQIPSLTVYGGSHDSRKTNKVTLFKLTLLTESLLRSLNSLQERFHQSFFFYLLPNTMRYVSIGVYMIPIGIIVVGGLLGQIVDTLVSVHLATSANDKDAALNTKSVLMTLSQLVLLGFGIGVSTNYAMEYSLSNSPRYQLEPGSALLLCAITLVIGVITFCRIRNFQLSAVSIKVVKLVLVLGIALFLGTLSILNVSMAFMVALFLIPTAIFVDPYRNNFARVFSYFFVIVVSNPVSLYYFGCMFHLKFAEPSFQSYLSFTDLHYATLSLMKHGLYQAWIECDILGSTTVNIACLVYLPIWSIFCAFMKLRV